MNWIFVIFRSRAQALDGRSLLRKNGVQACAVSTPREANVGCGISVRVGAFDLARTRRIVAGANYGALVGYFRVESKYGRVIVTRV